MSAYTDWAPKEFDEAAIEAKADGALTAAPAASNAEPQAVSQASSEGHQAQQGFVYDSSSG